MRTIALVIPVTRNTIYHWHIIAVDQRRNQSLEQITQFYHLSILGIVHAFDQTLHYKLNAKIAFITKANHIIDQLGEHLTLTGHFGPFANELEQRFEQIIIQQVVFVLHCRNEAVKVDLVYTSRIELRKQANVFDSQSSFVYGQVQVDNSHHINAHVYFLKMVVVPLEVCETQYYVQREDAQGHRLALHQIKCETDGDFLAMRK